MRNEKEPISEPEYEELTDCPDCGAKPGHIHNRACDIEMCSACGGQYFSCCCKNWENHDPGFARWTGLLPGDAEAKILGIDIRQFYDRNLHKIFFVKPLQKRRKWGPKK